MARRTDELLYDSQAALRLVDHELSALRDPDAAGPASPAALPALVERATAEVAAVLATLRSSRDALAQTGVERLRHTGARLRAVSSATELAATDILDALDRAGRIVDQLDADAADAAESVENRGSALRSELRDEIFRIVGALQFQDLTAQQLDYASSVLAEVESRLTHIALLLDPEHVAALPDGRGSERGAPTGGGEARQALADQIFRAVARR